ncbi:MAG TPA: hypothetical protein VFW23_06580, partial [Tepidisphaeraceae bacterium]|nr:hypothetical protein [Tepidisphaeraceae bacterium]
MPASANDFARALVTAFWVIGQARPDVYSHPTLPPPSNWPRIMVLAIFGWIALATLVGTIALLIRRRLKSREP